MTRVAAIVVTYDSEKALPSCLAALKGEVDEIIVVDNASADATVSIATAAGAVVIRDTENRGYGIGNNRGVEAAEGFDWCLIVNPDVAVERGCVAALLAAATRHPNAVLVVPRLTEPDGRVFFREESILDRVDPVMPNAGKPPQGGEGAIAFASGACMLVNRVTFMNLEGFDRNIFLFYEDDDLSLRVRRTGFEIIYVDAARALHLRGKSSTPRPGTAYRSRFHQAWSREYIARKYGLPANTLATIARSAAKLAFAWIAGKRDKIERHQGSLAGAWAAFNKRPHTVKETV